MIGSEERYRRLERRSRLKIAAVSLAAFVAVALIGGVTVILFQLHQQAVETAQILADHSDTLAHIAALDEKIRTEQKSAGADRVTIAGDIAKITANATALAEQVTAGNQAASANAAAICDSLNAITATLHISTACTST
ncbi:MAG: hypothetical protein KGH75_00155 [Rhodospirillales bacterium]|nr:hypothetical protein [Rhodospirillales bacterium]